MTRLRAAAREREEGINAMKNATEVTKASHARGRRQRFGA